MDIGILMSLYKKIYNTNFKNDGFKSRMKMQKGIYLLQEKGFDVGEYGFSWYKRGPYSQALNEDVIFSEKKERLDDIVFTDRAEEALQQINMTLDTSDENVTYSPEEWAECISSIQYLRKNICPIDAPDKTILNELKQRKAHLFNDDGNKIALERVKSLFG